MKNFEIIISPAGNNYFTVYIYCKETKKDFEFCGSMPEVGDVIRRIVTQ